MESDNYVRFSPEDAIRDVSFKGYNDAVKIQEDMLLLMNQRSEFKPSRGVFYFRTGTFQEFVKIRGPISIPLKDGAYDVDIVIWFAIHHPHKSPMLEVKPSNSSQAVKCGKHVESDGRVTHPYLQNWKHPHSNIEELLKSLTESFVHEPPIYNTQLTFYHVPAETGARAVPRPETRLHSSHKSRDSEYVASNELETFAKSAGLSDDILWWLAQNGFQTVKAVGCMRESDFEKVDLPLADMVQLREAVSNLHGTPREEEDSAIERDLGKTLMRMMQRMSLKAEDLDIEKQLGEGNFGVVVKASLRIADTDDIRDVAMKTLQRHATQQHLDNFLEEVINMRPLHHQNVMGMLGFVQIKRTPYIIMDYMEQGDLRTYVLDPKRDLCVTDTLRLSIQVAQGMAYLADQHFIHGDLAARNCFLSDDGTVKVGDFGLARHLFMSDYYRTSGNKPCPSRWMAPEVLHHSVYTLKSDVWSYGVVMWELLTRGKTPFDETAPILVGNLIQTGFRLGRPKAADSAIYRIMKECWNDDDEARPIFGDICEWLSKMVKSGAYSDRPVTINEAHIEPLPPRHKHVSKVSSLMA